MTQAPTHPASGLSIPARFAFESIALRQPGGHPHDAIQELLDAGLIEPVPRGRGWVVPIPHHVAFCEWCSTQEPL